jgi:hypothetical protein
MARYLFTARERDVLLEALLAWEDGHPEADVDRPLFKVLSNAPQRRQKPPPPDPIRDAIAAQEAARSAWVAWQGFRHNRVVRERQRGQASAAKDYARARVLYARAVLREDPE